MDGRSTGSKVGQTAPLWDHSFDGKAVVIGLGNPYMRDDAIGILVARELRRTGAGPGVEVLDYHALDLSTLLSFGGASRVVVVDALKGGGPPGTVSRYSINPAESALGRVLDLHGMQLYDMLDLANHAELFACPVFIVGVEPEDLSLGEGLSPSVSAALPLAVQAVLDELGRGRDRPRRSAATRRGSQT